MTAKICGICHLGIDETKEFVKNTQFKNKDEIFSEGYYHLNCFREKLSGAGKLNALQNQANKLLHFAQEKMGMTEEVSLD